MKKVIRLTESDIHRIVETTIKKILRENDEDLYRYGQYFENPEKFIVVADFCNDTFIVKMVEIETFNNFDSAMRFITQKLRDREYIYDLGEKYIDESEYDENAPNILNFEIYQKSVDKDGHNSVFTSNAVRIYS